MHKYLLIISMLMLTYATAFSQTNQPLQGPKAKNYKPWLDNNKTQSVIYYSTAKQAKKMGPAAKNLKPWQDKGQKKTAQIIAVKPKKLQGPAAKNRKPWQ